MYLGPLDQDKVWNTRDIIGVHRFLQRMWRNLMDEQTGQMRISEVSADDDLRKLLHGTIKKVTDDMERMSFNTAIAALIELNNALVARAAVPREVAESMVLMLGPMAPHVCEELWSRLGHERSLTFEPWPACDESLLVEDQVEYPVQINGKVRGRVTVSADADHGTIEQAVLANDSVRHSLGDKTVRKIIIVPGKMVNVVAN